MSQLLTQSIGAPVVVLLSKDSIAVTGLTSSDVTCQFRKEGGTFSVKALSGSNFHEIGLGVYTVDFTAGELNTLGALVVVIQGVTIDQSTTVDQVVPPETTTTAVSLQTCVLTGHVNNLLGRPQQNITISAQVLGMPSIEQFAAALTDDMITAITDVNGEFILELVRLADVEITIPAANYRRRITVPNQASADLFTEVP
jgi:hypothetical protein